jgi:chromosome segregation protein
VHFTRLRLTGFKSFVDSTELWIEPGMTGVVGPNGCGKSNLVEAMRWVMGETSAKQMRGSGMEDVIFNGTDTRPARNVAEVSLVLDNAERTAPAGYNDRDEIDVSRRIERGEGSLYRVNGSDVRARDVQTLFADAATGARSTALVSQGRIGTIISAKPTDRRHLLEEAAGITGLHSRRHEAELRLRAAESNLERLDDVLGALEEQLKALKKQARQATRYRNLSDHIRKAEAISFHHQWAEALAEREAAKQSYDAAEASVAALTGEVARATSGEAEAASALPALREKEAVEAAALQRLILARDGLEQEERRIEAERQEIERRITQINSDLEREAGLKTDAETALARLDQEIASLTAAQNNEEQEAADSNEQLTLATEAVNHLEQQVTTLTQSIASNETRQSALKRQIADCEVRRTRIAQRLEEAARDRKAAKETLSAAGVAEEVSERVIGSRKALDAARTAFDEAEKRRSDSVASETNARATLQEADTRLARLRAEEEALRALLTVGDPDLWPPMIDALSVEPGYELAIAAALGDDLNAASDEAAPIHWRELPPFSSPPPLPSGVAPLSSVVSAPAPLTRRLSQIGLVDDDAKGNALVVELVQGQRLVSRDGSLWRWDGFTAIGEATDSAATRLTQRNRLRDLHAECDRAERLLAEDRARYDAVHGEAEQAAEQERSLREAVRQADAAFQEARDQEAALNKESAEARSRLQSLEETSETLRADDAETATVMRNAEQELAGLDDIVQRREEAAAIRTSLAEARTAANEYQAIHDRLIREAATRRQRLSDIQQELESWRRRVDNANHQSETLLERRKAAEETLERLTVRPAEIATQREALFEQITAAEKTRDAAADTLAEAETVLAQLGRALKGAEARLAEVREERVRCEAAVEQIDQSMAVIRERADERIGCQPGDALEAVGVEDNEKLPDRTTIETRLERLKRERENMGPVNLRADVEAAELDERITTMLNEREDLISAIARLRQGISNLNKEGRARLLAAFKEVDTHFRELFTRLFGGGRAHLALTEAEDPLDAGLEIMASPPGKKLQAMSLLSGGEQALTALALLFGVFLTNPAPICVLDEVDAPLDDANVERFCQLISEIAEKTGTRFLVVTHHRLTMARVDRLFGVTMSERGVSQLVSVDLQAAEQLRESA